MMNKIISIILAIVIGLAFFLSFYHPETKVSFNIGDVGWCLTKQYRDFAIQMYSIKEDFEWHVQ